MNVMMSHHDHPFFFAGVEAGSGDFLCTFGTIVFVGIFGQDFLRHEQETLKANASQIDQALQALDPVQCTLGPEWARCHVVMFFLFVG